MQLAAKRKRKTWQRLAVFAGVKQYSRIAADRICDLRMLSWMRRYFRAPNRKHQDKEKAGEAYWNSRFHQLF